MHSRAIFQYGFFEPFFLAERDFVGMFWCIFLVIKAKQDRSSCDFPFNLFCELFFDRFHQMIEAIGLIET